MRPRYGSRRACETSVAVVVGLHIAPRFVAHLQQCNISRSGPLWCVLALPMVRFLLPLFSHFPGTATCRVFFYRLRVGYPDPLVQRSIPLRPRGALPLLGRLVGSVRVRTRRRLLVWVAQSSMQFAQQVCDPLRYCFGNLGSCGQLAGHSCLDFFDDYALARRLQGRSCAVSTGHSSTRERQIPDTTPETVLSFHKRGAARAPSAERGWTKSQPRGGVAPFEKRRRPLAWSCAAFQAQEARTSALVLVVRDSALSSARDHPGLLRSDGCKCQRCARV